MNMFLIVWAGFAACVVAIGWAGTRLSRYGDVIAEKTGLGGTWIGLVLLATVTSLPELVTGVSSVAAAGEPNIAVGDVLGSCVFNLCILMVLDFLQRGESVYRRVRQGHILSAGFGVILLGLVAFSLLVEHQGPLLALGHVGLYTPLIILLYLFAMRTVFRYEREQMAQFVEEAVERYPDMSLRQAVIGYGMAAVVVVGAGILLPFIGDHMAALMGWHKSFVGTLFVAFATSMPELAVTVAALRLGALDMAIANLFGSNLFDILILAVDDLVYLPGPILAAVSPVHAASAVSAMVMSGVVIVGLLYRPPERILRAVGWVSLFLLSIYLLNSFVLFLYGD